MTETYCIQLPERKITMVIEDVEDSVLAISTKEQYGNNNVTPEGKSDIPGRVKWREVSSAVSTDNLDERRNYKMADYINYMDGDVNSSIYYQEGDDAYTDKGGKLMYEYSKTSLVNNWARVYKGGSWRDRAFWMSPGARRYLDEKQRTDDLGFRCAMDRLGSPEGNGRKTGINYTTRRQNTRKK